MPKPSLEARLRWARWVLRQKDALFRRIVYTDGVTFYLDRSEDEVQNSARAALGMFVWRQADHKDALSVDCVGPSKYSKAQGKPVRVWGLLVRGQLHLKVLPAGTVLNKWYYQGLIQKWFGKTIGGLRQPLLIQDYERALRAAEPLQAFKDAKIKILQLYPKNAQDLNACENAWAFLRSRLDDTRPIEREDRSDFLRRLRAAVAWINNHHRAALLSLSLNLKERARDVLKKDGARTAW